MTPDLYITCSLQVQWGRRIRSSRSDGDLSRSPATPGGKYRSAQNSLRHWLLSRALCSEDSDVVKRQAIVSFAGLTLALLASAAAAAAAVQVSVPGWSAASGTSVAIPVMGSSQGGSASGI